MRKVQMGDGRTTITTPYMSLSEAAVYCCCVDSVLADAMADRRVGYIQIDAQTIVFDMEELDAFLKDHQVGTWHDYIDGEGGIFRTGINE